MTFTELAQRTNPVVRGWLQYYGAFYRSALFPLLRRINAYLVRRIRKKFKRLQKFQEGPRALATHHPPAPQALRSLDMDTDVLVTRMTRAV
ncbi:hypothetical protein NCC78_01210 [Micromonospora phytophila]|nr:hypothetical protein [Micromonospora phytophila]